MLFIVTSIMLLIVTSIMLLTVTSLSSDGESSMNKSRGKEGRRKKRNSASSGFLDGKNDNLWCAASAQLLRGAARRNPRLVISASFRPRRGVATNHKAAHSAPPASRCYRGMQHYRSSRFLVLHQLPVSSKFQFPLLPASRLRLPPPAAAPLEDSHKGSEFPFAFVYLCPTPSLKSSCPHFFFLSFNHSSFSWRYCDAQPQDGCGVRSARASV